MSLKMKFGAEVYHARNQHGLTQEQLAEAVQKSTRSIQYIEKGDMLPKPETMLRLMIVLQIEPSHFAEEVGIHVSVYSRTKEAVHI